MSWSPGQEQPIDRPRYHLIVGSPTDKERGELARFSYDSTYMTGYWCRSIHLNSYLISCWLDCRGCRRASASLASDYHRILFGERFSRDRTLLSPHKISHWDTVLCVLG